MRMHHLRKSDPGPLHQTDCDVEMSKKTAAPEASMHHTGDATALGEGGGGEGSAQTNKRQNKQKTVQSCRPQCTAYTEPKSDKFSIF